MVSHPSKVDYCIKFTYILHLINFLPFILIYLISSKLNTSMGDSIFSTVPLNFVRSHVDLVFVSQQNCILNGRFLYRLYHKSICCFLKSNFETFFMKYMKTFVIDRHLDDTDLPSRLQHHKNMQ